MQFQCGRYHSDEGYREVVYATGRKHLHLVWIDNPVRVRVVPLEEARYITPALLHDKPYPLDRAAKLMLKAGRAKGMTHQAQALLIAARDSQSIDEKEFDEMKNDPENPAPVETEEQSAQPETKQEDDVSNKKPKGKKSKAPKKTKVPAKVKAPLKAKANGARRPSKKNEAFPIFKKYKDELGRKEQPRGWISMVAKDIAKKVDTNEGSANDYVRAFLAGYKPPKA